MLAGVLAAILAATVWAGLLTWRASPAVSRLPGGALARHPGAVIPMARARQQRRRQRAAQAAVDTITAAVAGGAAPACISAASPAPCRIRIPAFPVTGPSPKP